MSPTYHSAGSDSGSVSGVQYVRVTSTGVSIVGSGNGVQQRGSYEIQHAASGPATRHSSRVAVARAAIAVALAVGWR